jgi:hypothetical protein
VIVWLAGKVDLRDYLIIFGRNIDSICCCEIDNKKSGTSSEEDAG